MPKADLATARKVVADLEALLPFAPRTRKLLEEELARRRAVLDASAASSSSSTAAAAAPAPAAAPPPKPLSTEKVAASAAVAFGSISRYAWDQTKKFVKVYVTLPGVEDVPDDKIHLDVQPTSLKFEVCGLPKGTANMRLLVPTLHGEVDASQGTWARKADSMVLIKLRKAAEGDAAEWGSLDDSAVLKAKREAAEAEQNKGKSTGELLSKMYANADEEGKKSLEEAWEAGRSKREGRA